MPRPLSNVGGGVEPVLRLRAEPKQLSLILYRVLDCSSAKSFSDEKPDKWCTHMQEAIDHRHFGRWKIAILRRGASIVHILKIPFVGEIREEGVEDPIHRGRLFNLGGEFAFLTKDL